MIRISQIKCPIPHTDEHLKKKAASAIHVKPSEIRDMRILQRSVDARNKSQISYVYTLALSLSASLEKKLLAGRSGAVTLYREIPYVFPEEGDQQMKSRPVVVGSGPAGLFCAYELALHGYQPLLLERGDCVETRRQKVDLFWSGGKLDPESNVQFGEGGAGTFSDGKLNTGIKNNGGRLSEVLKIFVRMGAPEEILFDSRRHIGTDLLADVVRNIRQEIIRLGGTVRFRAKVTDLILTDGRLQALILEDGEKIPAETAVLALGHSARDTFHMLYQKKIPMESKAFAVGLRAELPASFITAHQYGPQAPAELGAANYKLTAHTSSGRGVYTFCMCPGGYVVNASSEPGRTAVNGMSRHARDARNSNSAVVVTVQPEDFPAFAGNDCPEVLSGIAFQRELERRAFELGKGSIPVQRFEDYQKNQAGGPGSFEPEIRGSYTYANVREVLPQDLAADIEEGLLLFDRKMKGFASPDLLLSAVESRTSSPVRILRNECQESSISGIYPCGEGAGYAGGITSAAADGLRVAESIARKYKKAYTIS